MDASDEGADDEASGKSSKLGPNDHCDHGNTGGGLRAEPEGET
jgi:hypothetical protein